MKLILKKSHTNHLLQSWYNIVLSIVFNNNLFKNVSKGEKKILMVMDQLQPLPQPLPQCVGKAVFCSSDLGILYLQELTTLQRISASYSVSTEGTETF